MLLRAEGLKVRYGLFEVVSGVSFAVGEKEVVSVLGPNGAGKTSILRAVSGCLGVVGGALVAGTVEFLGRRVEDRNAHELAEMGVVHVPEGRELFPSLSVAENLKLGCVTTEAKRRFSESLEFVTELFPFLRGRYRQLAGTLSGGEQQMLAIARGLMALPKLLLLDEPSLGLAPLVVREVFGVIPRIAEAGTAVVLVEQHVQNALAVSHRAYVVARGRIVLEGASVELLRSDKLRAAYLGA